jgi:putative heme iron utilization protein
MDQDKLLKIQRQMADLLASRESVLLASTADDGTPHASYAPVIMGDKGQYYIHISELAKHYHNLNANGRVSALIIEDEKDAANIFARKRLTLDGKAVRIDKESANWNAIMDKFGAKFGEFFNQSLRKQGDFHTFELSFACGHAGAGLRRGLQTHWGSELGQIDWLQGAHGQAGTGLATAK